MILLWLAGVVLFELPSSFEAYNHFVDGNVGKWGVDFRETLAQSVDEGLDLGLPNSVSPSSVEHRLVQSL